MDRNKQIKFGDRVALVCRRTSKQTKLTPREIYSLTTTIMRAISKIHAEKVCAHLLFLHTYQTSLTHTHTSKRMIREQNIFWIEISPECFGLTDFLGLGMGGRI